LYPLIIYFYKVNAPYGCFSNFSPHSIDLGGKKWATVEHYYQAHKFEGTEFEYLMAEIQAAPTPALAAKIGRDPAHQPHANWDLHKCEIMYRAVLQKFSSHLDIQQVLLDTLDTEIVEDSPVDYFWGCGIDRSGQNQLGQILMQVRSELIVDIL
jgi:N-glycosidase YbiA